MQATGTVELKRLARQKTEILPGVNPTPRITQVSVRSSVVGVHFATSDLRL